MASLGRIVGALPLPLFGSVATAGAYGLSKARALPRFAGWAVPLSVGALWFVWPAVDDGWKIEMGFKADPEAAKKAAEEAAAAAPAKVELSSEAMAKIESAYVPASAGDDEGDALLKSAMATGDYSKLEEKWEAFTIKAVKPGEDDDDDDDDDDEDEDEDDEDDDDDDE
mmetsp:Transcript_30367/g.68034  ORF Transcript_30367/g.68034 Transcript_30367/m.68034 type:complete len:169 (-) Transcript_30367:77-583(-)